MHTISVIGGGLALLGAMLLAARALGAPIAQAALLFVPVWLVAAAINMWIGVSRAGYAVAQEFPIFLVVFGIPVIAAALIRWRGAR